MTGIKSPTVRHRRLARELRKHRERAGLTTEAASDRLGWSRTKLVRFEAARTRPTPADVSAALDLYGADLPDRAALMDLARQARQRGWWTAYSDVFQSSFVALEDEASSIRGWYPQVIPGLLQTDAYAHTLLSAGGVGLDRITLERRLQARLARRALLSRPSAPSLHVVLDEAAIRRGPTTPGVMAEQLASLEAAARRPNITVQVLPFSAGMHAGLDGGFVVLGYHEPEDPDVAYVETAGGEIYIESSLHVDRIGRFFEDVSDAAWSPGESAAFLAATAKEVSQHGDCA
ncbi:XRE family transcriptional regulator [Actinomadura logoneensis]|uniref:XRE family transcriptional regulator n=1 Tax=Actinomadura logoneensis TaxID=2293572 RepID=A0A372JM12_9ACTN|nr:helix-turn-helix transcriptional regulator [Actinomadura logoneensis]RFU40856.1 XRE family transcriptional regulator [Actinomadura logoneensis]